MQILVHLTTTRHNISDDDNSEFRTLKLVFVMRNEVANRVGIARNMFLFTVNVKLNGDREKKRNGVEVKSK